MLQLILTYLFKPIERICTFTGTLTVQSVAQAYSLSLSLSKFLSQMFIKIMLTMLQIHVTYSDIAVYIHVHG